MLQNSFYKIVNMDSGQQDCTATICLNREHEIYKAHFPGQPVTPGVCQIQIVTEILALQLNENVYLSDIKNVKYMAVISPEEVSELTVDIPDIPASFQEEEGEIELLYRTIGKLPEKCKQVFLMACLNDKTYQEIANTLGVSVNTVKTQMKYALKFLRDNLQEDDFCSILVLLTKKV